MKSALRRTARTVHLWLALLVGAQVLVWVVGGAVFALLPFDAWVKSGDAVRKAAPVSMDSGVVPLGDIAQRHAPLRGIELIAQGPSLYYRLTDPKGAKFLVDARSGQPLGRPDAERIRRLALDLYAGDGAFEVVRLLEHSEPRAFGLVDETHGKLPVWQARFSDRLGTRLYFSPDSGEFLRARNDAWVLYDFFWRLHIMDYGEGENFNNALLRLLAPLALLLVASGAVLLCYSRFLAPRSRP